MIPPSRPAGCSPAEPERGTGPPTPPAPPPGPLGRSLDRTFAKTSQLRTQGTDNLLAAAREAGAGRVVAQSYAPYRYLRQRGPIKTEADPLDPTPPPHTEKTFPAMAHLDEKVAEYGGIVLRYGGFYGAANDGGAAGGRPAPAPAATRARGVVVDDVVDSRSIVLQGQHRRGRGVVEMDERHDPAAVADDPELALAHRLDVALHHPFAHAGAVHDIRSVSMT